MKRMFKSFQTFGFHNSYIYIYTFKFISICSGLLGVAEVLVNASGFKPRGLQDPKCTEYVTWIHAVGHLRSSERVRLTFSFFF